MFFNRTQLGASNATKTEAKYLKALEQVAFRVWGLCVVPKDVFWDGRV